MALPFLPAAEITEAFEQVRSKLTERGDTRLHELAQYFETTWVSSQLWPPHAWSVYMETVRTNNDVEG